jgi:hypothetical protein
VRDRPAQLGRRPWATAGTRCWVSGGGSGHRLVVVVVGGGAELDRAAHQPAAADKLGPPSTSRWTPFLTFGSLVGDGSIGWVSIHI